MIREKIPLVSVIIPMYNSAKFIPQTLESLLCQTMTDFEVIVVDDCSTDNSIEVVENFVPVFKSIDNEDGAGGIKLDIIKLPKNTGMPGFPRNVGIQFARGKYIAFLDSDDIYTTTALEELSKLAEEFQAEIVHMDHFFKLWGGKGKSVDDPLFTNMDELIDPKNYFKARTPRYTPDKPTLETNNLAERVKKFLAGGYAGEPYTNFYRRDFLISRQIAFPPISAFEDQIFAFHTMCLAEKLLRVPNVTYILRPRIGSTMRRSHDMADWFHETLRIYIDGFNELSRIMDGIDFFVENADCRYSVLDWFVGTKLNRLLGCYEKNPPSALNMLVEKEFHSDDAFAAYIFNTLSIQRLKMIKLEEENRKLRENQKR